MAHVKRRDHRVALIERLAVAWYWWNPLLYRVNRRIARERELICDDYAAANAAERRGLAEVLVMIAEWSSAAPLRVGGATALVDDAQDDLAGRVKRLVDNQPRVLGVTRRAMVGFAAFALALGGVVMLSALRANSFEWFQPTAAQKAIIAELRDRSLMITDGADGFQVTSTGPHLSDADIARLVDLGNVVELILGSDNLSDDCLKSVGRLTSLRKLSLQPNSFHFSNGALAAIARLPNLEDLSIVGPYLTDAGLAALAGLPKLARLRLDGTSVSDKGLEKLPEFPALVALEITGSRYRISDAGLAAIARIPRLTKLTIASTEMTDAGLQSLAARRTLTTLDLRGNGLSGEGLRDCRAAELALTIADR